jgi:molecular chaperone GrpE
VTDPVPDEVEAVEEAPAPDAVAVAEAERDEYLDALRRLKAEFDNYRKRTDREREAAQLSRVRDLVADLLPVMDNLERAVQALGASEAERGVVAGVEMVKHQLEGLLTARGVEEVDAHARPFDPAVHEAVTQAPSEHPEGHVAAVIERGFTMREALLRPARVVVSTGAPDAAGEEPAP